MNDLRSLLTGSIRKALFVYKMTSFQLKMVIFKTSQASVLHLSFDAVIKTSKVDKRYKLAFFHFR